MQVSLLHALQNFVATPLLVRRHHNDRVDPEKIVNILIP